MKFEVRKIDLFKGYRGSTPVNNVPDTERVELELAPDSRVRTPGTAGPMVVSMVMWAPAGTFSAGEEVDVAYEEEG